jgi:hypothetical protein
MVNSFVLDASIEAGASSISWNSMMLSAHRHLLSAARDPRMWVLIAALAIT